MFAFFGVENYCFFWSPIEVVMVRTIFGYFVISIYFNKTQNCELKVDPKGLLQGASLHPKLRILRGSGEVVGSHGFISTATSWCPEPPAGQAEASLRQALWRALGYHIEPSIEESGRLKKVKIQGVL